MRSFLNAILAFIGASSLTDAEFTAFELTDAVYSADVYLALLAIIDARESISDTRDRLKYYFLARGTQVTEPEGKSNILVGGVLCS